MHAARVACMAPFLTTEFASLSGSELVNDDDENEGNKDAGDQESDKEDSEGGEADSDIRLALRPSSPPLLQLTGIRPSSSDRRNMLHETDLPLAESVSFCEYLICIPWSGGFKVQQREIME